MHEIVYDSQYKSNVLSSHKYTFHMYSLYNFYDKTYYQLILSLIATVLVLFFYANIGSIFFKKVGFFQRIFLGLAFSASILTSLISFNANFGRIFVDVLTFLVLLFGLIKIVILVKNRDLLSIRVKKSFKYFDSSTLVFVIVALSLFLIMVNELNRKINGNVMINAHQTYFSGVPLEIFQARYSERLRVFDSYPITYPKYHFFNGSIYAILMRMFAFKSYEGFMIARIVLIALFCAVLVELISDKKRLKPKFYFTIAAFCAYIFTILPNQIYWALNMNHYINIFLIIIFFVTIHKQKETVLSLAFLVPLFISSSRTAFPAILIGLFILFDKFKKQNYLSIIKRSYLRLSYFLVYIVATISMFIAGNGDGTINIKTVILFPFNSIFFMPFMNIMSPSIAKDNVGVAENNFTQRMNDLSPVKPSILFFLYFIFIIFIIFSNLQDRNLHDYESKIFKTKKTIFLYSSIIFFVAIVLSTTFENKISRGFSYFIAYYLIPIASCYFLFSSLLKKLVFIWIGVSLAEILVFIPSIWVPNWLLVEWIVLLGICLNIQNLFKSSKQKFIAISIWVIIVVTQGLPLSPLNIWNLNQLDRVTHLVEINEDILNLKPISDGNFYCYKNYNESILYSLKGTRSTYDPHKSNSYAVGPGSSQPEAKDLEFLKINCP